MVKMPHWPVFIGSECSPVDSLVRVKKLLPLLHNPQLNIKNIFHITGTKGKGSTALFIANIFQVAGYKVNVYTSPHIYECNERIKICGNNITDHYLYDLIEEVRYVCDKHNLEQPSLMEAMTCCALLAFSRIKADINIFEVGMGGLFDTTNVFQENPPVCSVFTPIHLDHKLWLGETIEDVVFNKSFIAPVGTRNVVLSSQSTIATKCLESILHSREIKRILKYGVDYEIFEGENGNLIYSSQYFDCAFEIPYPKMQGKHQFINAACAITAALSCIEKFSQLSLNSIGIAIPGTYNIARMERVLHKKYLDLLPSGSLFYMDGAHNQLASFMLVEFISDFRKYNNGYKVCIILARSKGAEHKAFLSSFISMKNSFNEIDLVICTRANLESIPESPEYLANVCQELKLNYKIAHKLSNAVKIAGSIFEKQKLLVIATGSLYIARDILAESLFEVDIY